MISVTRLFICTCSSLLNGRSSSIHTNKHFVHRHTSPIGELRVRKIDSFTLRQRAYCSRASCKAIPSWPVVSLETPAPARSGVQFSGIKSDRSPPFSNFGSRVSSRFTRARSTDPSWNRTAALTANPCSRMQAVNLVTIASSISAFVSLGTSSWAGWRDDTSLEQSRWNLPSLRSKRYRK